MNQRVGSLVLTSKTYESSSSPPPSQTQKRQAGRKKFQETRHPVFKGVRSRNGKWVSELRGPNNKSRIWLGTFSSSAMAAKAYDAAALALRGDSASLNFPESASELPRARSSSIRDIQSAAMEAAKAFCDINVAKISSPSLSPASLLPLLRGENSLEDVKDGSSSEKSFVDEEELFNMPVILDSMAEGLILTPPAMKKGYYWDDDKANHDSVVFTLWCD